MIIGTLIGLVIAGYLITSIYECGSRCLDTTTDWGIIDMPPPYKRKERSPQEEDNLCRLKREARQRGEHIVG